MADAATERLLLAIREHPDDDVPVTVTEVDLRSGNQIVAVCVRGREQQAVGIVDLPLPSPPPVGAEWIGAYRHWLSLL